MGYVLENQLEVSVYFDDIELPLDSMNTLDGLVVECMIGTILPTFFLKVTDATDIIQTKGLAKDGAPIQFVVKRPGDNKPRTLPFRIFKSKNITTQMGSQWLIDGYFDRVRYWLETTNVGLRGTSSTVMTNIAQRCGLQFDIERTSDSQLWLPQNKTWGEFVRTMAGKGYSSPESLMLQGVDLSGVLHYKDFNRERTSSRQMVYGKYSDNEVPIMDYAPAVQSGLTNRLTGYNNVMRTQSTVRDSSEYKELTFKPDSKDPMLNMNVKAESARGYQRFGPIDFGNTHEDSEKAQYQNQRYANLYNLSVEFMTTAASGINIFDTVSFAARSGGDDNDHSYAGTYKVSAYQMRIQAMSYAEYICGERHGTN